jgi:hypothetical protein
MTKQKDIFNYCELADFKPASSADTWCGDDMVRSTTFKL